MNWETTRGWSSAEKNEGLFRRCFGKHFDDDGPMQGPISQMVALDSEEAVTQEIASDMSPSVREWFFQGSVELLDIVILGYQKGMKRVMWRTTPVAGLANKNLRVLFLQAAERFLMFDLETGDVAVEEVSKSGFVMSSDILEAYKVLKWEVMFRLCGDQYSVLQWLNSVGPPAEDI